jgi:hypothetical protein
MDVLPSSSGWKIKISKEGSRVLATDYSTVKMEAIVSFETPANFYQSTRLHTQKIV